MAVFVYDFLCRLYSVDGELLQSLLFEGFGDEFGVQEADLDEDAGLVPVETFFVEFAASD